jgi:ribokinase
MITVFGSLNVDLVSRVAAIPKPGETVHGSDLQLIPGGKGANQALAARRAGAEVRMIGVIGDDNVAGVTLNELEPAGVDLVCVRRRHGTTGVAIIIVDAKGENTIVVSPGANAEAKAAQIGAGMLQKGDTLLLQMEVPLEETLAAARMGQAAGATVVLSLAPFSPLTPEQLAPVSTLIVNEHEAADFAQALGLATGDAEATVTGLSEKLSLTVIATLGPEGAIAAGKAGVVRVSAIKVKPVDTTGAGDTFAGVLSAWLDRGADLATAMKFAAIAGSLACTKEGAQPSFPTRAEIETAAGA